jgi:hypothetical protein
MSALYAGMVGRARATPASPWHEFRINWVIGGMELDVSWTAGGLGTMAGAEVQFKVDGTWQGATTGNLVNEASAGLVFDGDWLAAGHAGTAIRVYDETEQLYRYGVIGTVLDARSCSVTWDGGGGLTTGVPTLLWEEAAFSEVRGYARTVAFHQQRLILGGGRDVGAALWMSRSGFYYSFDTGEAKDGDAIAIVAGTGVGRIIQHVVEGPQLVVLTQDGSWYLPTQDGRPLTPATARLEQLSRVGSAAALPASFDGGVTFVRSTGSAVHDIHLDEQGNLREEPLTLAVTELIGQVIDAAYLPGTPQRPEHYGFFVNAAGKIALLHSMRSQKIAAWGEWITPDGVFRAVGVAGHSVFVVVERAGTIRLERFDQSRALDASLLLSRPGGTVPHLAGQTVHGWNGQWRGSSVVSGTGTLRLTAEANDPDLALGQVEVGLGFAWEIRPLPPALDLPDGTMLRRVQRLHATDVLLHGAAACAVDGTSLMLLTGEGGTVPTTYSGWWRTKHLGWSRLHQGEEPPVLSLTRDLPLPCGVLALRRDLIL